MSYVHYQKDIIPASSGGVPWFTCTASGVRAKWSPGSAPVYVKRIGIVHTTSLADPVAGTVNFWVTSQYPSTTSTNWTLIGTLTLTTLAAQGKMVYKDPTPAKITPPQGVLVEVQTITSGAVVVEPHIFIEPSWDQPANVGTCGYVASA